MKAEFEIGQTVFMLPNGIKGVVESICFDSSGVKYGVSYHNSYWGKEERSLSGEELTASADKVYDAIIALAEKRYEKEIRQAAKRRDNLVAKATKLIRR